MAREVTLVDAGLGNLASVERALIQVGAGVRVTQDPDKVATSRMVVFPGQSAFGTATQAIVDGAMGAALRMVIERGDPFLGICLGMQLLFEGSDESPDQQGLHVLDGWCRRFPDNLTQAAEKGAREKPPTPAEVIPAEAPAPQTVAPAAPAPVASVPTPSAPSVAAEVDADALFSTPPQAPPAEASPAPSPLGTTSETSAAPNLIQAPPPAANAEPEPEPLIRRLKVPHMGWNEVEPTHDHYYFVHSYYVEAKNSEDIMWMARYGDIRFPAAVRRGNVMGCQFHPEKSQRAGLRFLRAFLLGGWG
ncbi:MAG: hypothetical protein AAF721_41305 [Myxococcota bacterium]